MPMKDGKAAFRCKNCGHFEHAGASGRNQLPAACSACGYGVAWERGYWTPRPDNWEVLADATPERLEELGLTEEQVEQPAPATKEQDIAADLERINEAHATLTAKKEAWESADKAKAVEEWKALNAKHSELTRLIPIVSHLDQPRLINEREQVRQQMKEMENKEWTDRDAAHMVDLEGRRAEREAVLGGGPEEKRRPRSVFASALDGSAVRDDANRET